MIGDCHYVRAFWYRNAEPSGAAAWRYPIDPALTEANADWQKFLGPAKERPFDPHRYRQWRLYWDYSSGIATDLMVHQTDVTAFVLGRGIPSTVVARGRAAWTVDDDRDVPDTWSVLLDYPDKLHVNYSCYLGNAHNDTASSIWATGHDRGAEPVDAELLPEVYRPNMAEIVKKPEGDDDLSAGQ